MATNQNPKEPKQCSNCRNKSAKCDTGDAFQSHLANTDKLCQQRGTSVTG